MQQALTHKQRRQKIKKIPPNDVTVEYGSCLGRGSYGEVYPCTVRGHLGKIHCIKLASESHANRVRLQEECATAFLLREVDRCVRIEGITSKGQRVGMVMTRCTETMDYYVMRICKTEQNAESLLQWITQEIVLGLMGMHNAGVAHGDLKLSNMGIVRQRARAGGWDETNPWTAYTMKLFDFGMHAVAVSAGTYPFRASDWSNNPEQLLSGNPMQDPAITYRRSDWFQSLMVVFDVAHRACSLTDTSLNKQWDGVGNLAERNQAKHDARAVGDAWIRSGRKGGWLAFLMGRKGKTPNKVVELYASSACFRKIDQQLTMNFKTCL